MIIPNNFVDASLVVLLYSLTKIDETVKIIIRLFLRQKVESPQHNMQGFQVKVRLEAPNTKYCC